MIGLLPGKHKGLIIFYREILLKKKKSLLTDPLRLQQGPLGVPWLRNTAVRRSGCFAEGNQSPVAAYDQSDEWACPESITQ